MLDTTSVCHRSGAVRHERSVKLFAVLVSYPGDQGRALRRARGGAEDAPERGGPRPAAPALHHGAVAASCVAMPAALYPGSMSAHCMYLL